MTLNTNNSDKLDNSENKELYLLEKSRSYNNIINCVGYLGNYFWFGEKNVQHIFDATWQNWFVYAVSMNLNMADIFTQEKRSWVMSRIRGKDTKIELRMKQLLADTGYRFEMHPEMYGNPDFAHRRREWN